MSLHYEIKELTPRCRICGVEPEDVDEFIIAAQDHNANPYNAMKISPKTVCYSKHFYDPSTNSFICPDCEQTIRDTGQEDMYDITD